jgi:hypothetical protein
MNRRLLVLVAVGIAAAAIVGLSAAATMSARSGSPRPANGVDGMKKTARTTDVVGSPQSQPQTANDVASYWTRERIREAQPIQKTVPEGSQSSSPAPSGKVVRDTTSPENTSAAKPSKRKTSSSQAGPAGNPTGSDSSENAADYWTQDQMDDAQPIEKTVPGGDGSGGTSGSGGSTTPPAIP